jgi:hypothetical protein
MLLGTLLPTPTNLSKYKENLEPFASVGFFYRFGISYHGQHTGKINFTDIAY